MAQADSGRILIRLDAVQTIPRRRVVAGKGPAFCVLARVWVAEPNAGPEHQLGGEIDDPSRVAPPEWRAAGTEATPHYWGASSV
jgi:hypothetical protein